MKVVRAIALFGLVMGMAGCASLFEDPLQTAYESGEISSQEYERLRLERDEAMARRAAAHWELQQTFSEHQSKLRQE